MNRIVRFAAVTVALLALLMASSRASNSNDQAELLQAREAVWRAWFAGDTKTLEQLVPADTIVMSSDEAKWKDQARILQSATEFHTGAGKLTRLEFPRTEIQRFGDAAIIWSNFLVETEEHGQRSTISGRITEIFVRRDGRWVNPGWHSDSVK